MFSEPHEPTGRFEINAPNSAEAPFTASLPGKLFGARLFRLPEELIREAREFHWLLDNGMPALFPSLAASRAYEGNLIASREIDGSTAFAHGLFAAFVFDAFELWESEKRRHEAELIGDVLVSPARLLLIETSRI